MNQRVKTCQDKLHPDFCDSLIDKNENDHSRLKLFSLLDTVYALGFPAHKKWVPATIIEVLGLTMYYVQTNDGLIWKRHIDQL